MDWKQIQKRLHKLGFNPGPIDGIRGRMTVRAIRAFQASKGLVVDGIIGPNTMAALFAGAAEPGPAPHILDIMPWYEEAVRLIGTREVGGDASNPEILDWADGLGIDYADDDIPWCGLFVAPCVGSTLQDEVLPTNPLGARNWNKFGSSVDPQLGAVLVFWRSSPDSWKGHVGFYRGEDSDHFFVLGGNQSNSVNVAKITKDRLLSSRWPLTGLAGSGQTVSMTGAGPVSTNEA